MTIPLGFERRAFRDRLQGRGFVMHLRAGWVEEPVESVHHDFSKDEVLAPLIRLHDARNQMRLNIDARPAYPSGTLMQWARLLQEKHQLDIYSIEHEDIGRVNGVVGVATDGAARDGGSVRFAFLEREQHIIRISLASSNVMSGASLSAWSAVMESFAVVGPNDPYEEVKTGDPDWWQKAKQLEENNELDEAEAVIKRAVPHLGFASQTAQLYMERMLRLRVAGDRAGAADAHQRAANWIRDYASFATIGGEGAALSLERDQFLAELGPLPS